MVKAVQELNYNADAVIVAAGSAVRFGSDKMLLKIDGISVVRRSVDTFVKCGFFNNIIVVAGENMPGIAAELADMPIRLVKGGQTRFESVCNGVAECDGEIVAVHDGARPFVSVDVILNTLKAMSRARIAAPALPVIETVKIIDGEFVSSTPDRERLVTVQTPQTFYREDYLKAVHQCEDFVPTDDCSVMERAGHRVLLTDGDIENIKITNRRDIKGGLPMMRIGQGYDVHRLVKDRELILGGVQIDYELGLLGHSDADVLCHAVSDALLGAAALGDIGTHFPDSDERYKGADSIMLLSAVANLLGEKGYSVGNIDSVIIAQKPKLAPFIPDMRTNIAKAVGIPTEMVSVKATTEEGLGFTGKGEGIAASATTIIVKN